VGNEAIVSDFHELADKPVRLNAASFTDDGPPLDFYEWPDEAIVSDSATIEIYWFNDRDSLPKAYVEYAGLPNRRLDSRVLHKQPS